jgi:hypothetical protein
MINDRQYESQEEMEDCRKKGTIELRKLLDIYGFVVLDIAEEIRKERYRK